MEAGLLFFEVFDNSVSVEHPSILHVLHKRPWSRFLKYMTCDLCDTVLVLNRMVTMVTKTYHNLNYFNNGMQQT